MRVRLDSSYEIEVDLSSLPPQKHPYVLTCTANGFAHASSELFWLPPSPHGGSTVQLHRGTGALLVAGRKPVFPIGYYTSWGGHLDTESPALLARHGAAGMTLIHPVPGGGGAEEAWGSLERFEAFMDEAYAAGLGVMYDLRHTYDIPEALEAQVRRFRNHPALLLWYTADVPPPPFLLPPFLQN